MSTRPFNPKPVSLSGLWFPVALALLLLLTIPAAILLVLKLLGREAKANEWLQEKLRISYQVALPGWAAVVLLLVPFLLVLLYFLKMRRQALQVPSTFLWRKSVEDLHVNSLFQWLRKNLLLLLQLACVLLLIFAVMAFKVFGSGGKHYILLIDSSASMSVADVEPNRLEAAKRMALDEIARHTDSDVGMVIEFNGSASVLQGYTSDRNLMRDAVRRIVATQQPTRLDGALRQAESLANPPNSAEDAKVRPPDEDPTRGRAYVPPEGIRAEVHLYSDGCFSQGEAEALRRFTAGNLDITYHQVGNASGGIDNVGLTAFTVAPDKSDSLRLLVSVRVQNFRASEAKIRVELKTRVWGKADFKLADPLFTVFQGDERADPVLTLPGRTFVPDERDKGQPGRAEAPGALAVFRVDRPSADEKLELHARLLDPRGEPFRDQFPLDDQAWLIVGGVRKARVLLVTPGNEVLDWFFRQEKATEVDRLNPSEADYGEKYARVLNDAAVDLVIFDRCSPPMSKGGNSRMMPQANTFFIDQIPPPFTLSADEKKKLLVRGSPRILNPSHRHPLMRGLTGLDEIVFTRAFRFELDPDKDSRLPPDVPRLLETEKDGAVLFVLPRGAFSDVVLACPLVTEEGKWASNWPAMVSFPLFLSNMLFSLGHVREQPADEVVQPGQVRVIRPGAAVDVVKVFAPADDAGKDVERSSEAGEFSYIADQVGVYRARWTGGDQPFAVNLLDADESDIRPREVIELGDQRLDSVKGPPATVDTWKWAVLIAIALLVVEWALYHRRFFR
jgi:hypothetical protein